MHITVDKLDTVGARMRWLRESRGLDIRTAAKCLQVAIASLSCIECNKIDPPLRVLQVFVDFYKVDAHWLLTGKLSIPVQDKIELAACYIEQDLSRLMELGKQYALERAEFRSINDPSRSQLEHIDELTAKIDAVTRQKAIVMGELKSLYDVNIEPVNAE